MRDKERKVTTESIYNLLKEKIFAWELAPGEKINIEKLSKEFTISAIPIREALSRLQSDKLVLLEPYKGYRVSGILDEKSMMDMLESRILMETYAVRNIIRLNSLGVTKELSRITEQIATIKMGTSYKEVLEFNQLDRQFHCSLVHAGENSFISEAYVGMHCHLHIARFYHIRGSVDQSETISEHKEIIEAIRTRDVYRAELAIVNHIQDAKNRLSVES